MLSQKHLPISDSKWHTVSGMLWFELFVYKLLLFFELLSALNSVDGQSHGAFQYSTVDIINACL